MSKTEAALFAVIGLIVIFIVNYAAYRLGEPRIVWFIGLFNH